MKVLHVGPSFAPAYRYGGPIVSVLRLCQSLRACGVDVSVVTTNCDGRSDLDVPLMVPTKHGGIDVTYFPRRPRVDYAFSPTLFRHLLRCVRDFDIVHITSTFSFPSLAAGVSARRAGVPYVVSPRGSLQAWAMQQKRWKKTPYWYLLERNHLKRAQFIHVTSEIEQEELWSLLPGVRTVLLPNGVDFPSLEPVERRPDRIVFLGRVHRKKGFDVLVPALVQVARVRPKVEVLVAGPDDEGEWARVEQALARCQPRPNITYIGPIGGRDKFRFLAEASAFVLPSHAENFGQAVVEALACGTPVVVSRNTPWRSVEESGAGYWVENTPEAVARGLIEVLSAAPQNALTMSSAARELARRFDWLSIARRMAEAYSSILSSDVGRRV